MNRLNYVTVFIFLYLIGLCLGCGGDKENIATFGSGTIEVDEIQIAPLVPGRISQILVEEGDSFQKGETLVTISAEEIRADVSAVHASLDATRKNVEAAESNWKKARLDLKRAKNLFASGSIPRQQLDAAENGYRVALASYQAAKDQVKQVSANLSRANTRFSETVLKGPLNGTVLTRNYEPGEVVMPGSPVLSVADLNSLYLKIFIPETDLSKVKLGQAARVRVDGLEKSIPAKVIQIADEAEFTPKNVQTKDARARLVYAVKLSVPNFEGRLKPGMPADGEIIWEK